MIVTELYNGQGLGNQLWCYFVTRIIAESNGYDFGVMSTHKFKAKDFMEIDFGLEVIGGDGPEGGPPTSLPNGIDNYYKEKLIRHQNSLLDISPIDPDLVRIPDNSKVDGVMQSYYYVNNYRDKILGWIRIKEDKKIYDYSDDNICVIHIRGGDFRHTQAMLGSEYYRNAMNYFRGINPNMVFYIVTDDVNYSESILPGIEFIGSIKTGESDPNKGEHHLGGPIWMDYSILNNAKNVIMSASSFGWWPVWTNPNNPIVVAPKYWAAYRQNSGYWSCGESFVEGWNFMNINGEIFSYDDCINEITR
jgi:hypothetical protein